MRRPARARPLDVPLDGDLLVEASAGTGKTYALTTLVARLIVESGWRINDLLIVTFTVAATGELRARVRGTIRDALDLARGSGQANGLAADLIQRWRNQRIDPEKIVTRLTSAIRDFDRANVMTIHGFCQRALTEFAFDARIPFGFVVSGDDGSVVAAAVRDFWRAHIAPEPIPLLEVAQSRWIPPGCAQRVGRRASRQAERDSWRYGLRPMEYASANAERLKAFQAARKAWDEPGATGGASLMPWHTLRWNQNRERGSPGGSLGTRSTRTTPTCCRCDTAGYFGRQALADQTKQAAGPGTAQHPSLRSLRGSGNQLRQDARVVAPGQTTARP